MHSGAMSFKDKDERHLGDRFHKACEQFCTMMVDWKPDLVIYEMVVGGKKAGGNTSLIQKGLEALAQLACARADIPFFDIGAGTIKKWATGDGSWNTTKLHMCKAAVDTFPNHVFILKKSTKAKPWWINDDEVDAVWLADLGCHMLEAADHPHSLVNKDYRDKLIKQLTREKWK